MARKAAIKKTTLKKVKQVEEINENDEIIEEAIEELEEVIEEVEKVGEVDDEEEEEEEEQEEEEQEDEVVPEIEPEDDDDDYNNDQDQIIYDTESSSSSIKPEVIFYNPPITTTNNGGRKRNNNNNNNNNSKITVSGGRSSKEISEQMGESSWNDIYKNSHCQQLSKERFNLQGEYYTQQQLDQLSSEIRRHPSIASKSYHFLSLGINTKINHQWIRIILSSLVMLSLIGTIFYLPLPHIKHIVMSPTGPSIQTTSSLDEYDQFSNIGGFSTGKPLTAFKDNWRRFSIFGVSNFLCSNYNFNPIEYQKPSSSSPGSFSTTSNTVADSAASIPKQFSTVQELKNLKIFGSCIFFGVLLFLVWLFSTKLSEKEIIIKSNIPLQILHSVLTLIVIPLITMILLSLFVLYFVQTALIGNQVNGQEDIFYCVNHLSTNLAEITTFSPIRELYLGSVGIAMRLVNYFYPLPIEVLALHETTIIDRNYNQMKLVSFLWALIVGSTIYHLMMVASYLYSIFHEYPINNQQHQAKIKSKSDPLNLLTLDLKFLPSFIPEVLLTQNFIIVFIWFVAASVLWIFGVPPNIHVHEGEIFFIFLSLGPLLKSIYNLVVIEQKKDKVNSTNTWLSEPELIEQQKQQQQQQQQQYANQDEDDYIYDEVSN